MRAFLAGVVVLGLAVAALVWVWPATVVARELCTAGAWSDAELSVRRLLLLWNGSRISIASGALASILGAGLAAGLAGGSGFLACVSRWTAMTVVFTPPYIYAYWWSLAWTVPGVGDATGVGGSLGEFAATEGRAILCLASWTSPIAALLLAAGWRAVGRRGYEAARLDAGPLAALAWGAAPAMRAWILLSIAFPSLLAFNEDTVCSLCLVPTMNTEVVASLQRLSTPGRGLAMAWPMLIGAGVVALVVWMNRGILPAALGRARLDPPDLEIGALAGRGARGRGLAALASIAVLLAPGAIAMLSVKSAAAYWTTWVAFANELGDSSAGALLSGALAVGIAMAFDAAWWRRANAAVRGVTALLAIAATLAAVIPAALVGDALAASWCRVAWIGEHWTIVAATTTARFGVIAIALITGERAASELVDCARVDGATPAQAYVRVRLVRLVPTLGASFLIVTMLSLTEVSASCLTRPGGVGSVALRMLNEIHFGRNDEVLAMCLFLALLAGIAAALVPSGRSFAAQGRWSRMGR